MILASADDMNISKLAEMADRIMNVGTPMVTSVSTSTEDDRIRKIFMRSLINNTGHAPEVFLIQKEGVGIIHVDGPLHIDIHLTDK